MQVDHDEDHGVSTSAGAVTVNKHGVVKIWARGRDMRTEG